jgi:hypothetical protein
LRPEFVQKFKKTLKRKEVHPEKLAKMSSEKRRNFIAKDVGEENAKQPNALFESKLLLKNQKAGYITWAKQVSGLSQRAKMDLISRIERMGDVLDPGEEKAFLEDLASTRLRIDVTRDEAKTINDLSKKVQEKRSKANKDGKFKTEKERLDYGFAKVDLENYINELKLQSRRISFKEQPTRKVADIIGKVPAIAKSLVASIDNSFWGRQGIKTLLDLRTSNIWARNFLKSWRDIGKELAGRDAMDLIRADIYSRPNSLNGKYKAGNYQLDVLSEEAFPTSIPERIPAFGRLFKASESAFNGGALRMRADLADRLIGIAEKNGVNTLMKEEAQGMGHLIGSMTGRGSLEMTPKQMRNINVLLFSIRFMKSNIDTLTAHQFDPKATKFTKGEARKNLLSIVATLAVVHTIAKILDPDSVDEDPRSTNFGKIKLFGHWVDTTGGMASFVRLIARTLVPTMHNGELGLWQKTSTGKWVNLTAGQYGQQDAFDVLVDGLFSNKLSPIAGMARDALRGEMFGGKKFNMKDAVANLITPLSIQNYQDLKDDPDSSFILGSVILEGIGLSTSTYRYKADWEKSTSKEMKQFKEKVGKDKFKQANEDYNRAYSNWYSIAKQSNEFKNLSEEGKAKLITKAKGEIKQQIFKEYKFKYKTEKKTKEQKKEEKEIKKLLPKK